MGETEGERTRGDGRSAWCRTNFRRWGSKAAWIARATGLFDRMNGVGAHEVIIETPDHQTTLAMLSEKSMEEVLGAYRDRMVDLKSDKRFRYLLLFKNHGEAAGASLEHTHSQLIALPIVPKRVQEELDNSKSISMQKERCIFCDIIRQEIETGSRVILENETFIALAPYAPRFPFETWILPRQHSSAYENMPAGALRQPGEVASRISAAARFGAGVPRLQLRDSYLSAGRRE